MNSLQDLNNITHQDTLSVNKRLDVSKIRYFGKYIIQLNTYFYGHVSGQRQTGLKENSSSKRPVTMLHVIHVLFVVFTVFENLKASFSQENMPVYALDVFFENATKNVLTFPFKRKKRGSAFR